MMRKRLDFRLSRHHNENSYLFEIHGSMDRLFAGYMRYDEIIQLRDFLNHMIRQNPSWAIVEVKKDNDE